MLRNNADVRRRSIFRAWATCGCIESYDHRKLICTLKNTEHVFSQLKFQWLAPRRTPPLTHLPPPGLKNLLGL